LFLYEFSDLTPGPSPKERGVATVKCLVADAILFKISLCFVELYPFLSPLSERGEPGVRRHSYFEI